MKPLSLDSHLVIGIDVSSFSRPVTGIGRYTVELVKRLVLIKNVHWILYSNKYYEEFKILEGPNVEFKFMQINFKYSKLIWGQIFLPIMLFKDRVNLFWSPTHRCPRIFFLKSPVVITIHDLNWKKVPTTMKFFSRVLDYFLMPSSVKNAKKIITVSKSTALDVSEEFPHAVGKIYPIHLGSSSINKNKIVSKEIHENLESKKYILFVGTLEPRKNLNRLIAAFSLMPKNIREDIKLVIVGGAGWGINSIDEICHQFNIAENVLILGYVNDFELEQLYQNALFIVIPSLYEGFGLPIVEAMKYGVPSLTSNLSSMPEIAGDASIQVDPYSVESIKKGLLTMICDEQLLVRLRNCAIERHHQFDWGITAQKTMNVFWDALNDK